MSLEENEEENNNDNKLTYYITKSKPNDDEPGTTETLEKHELDLGDETGSFTAGVFQYA